MKYFATNVKEECASLKMTEITFSRNEIYANIISRFGGNGRMSLQICKELEANVVAHFFTTGQGDFVVCGCQRAEKKNSLRICNSWVSTRDKLVGFG